MRVIEEINQTLHKLMNAHKEMVILGEDILDPYGGAFKATKDLSRNFPDRVITTPVSEAAIIGFASGLAMQKKPVIVEIMFGDFLGLAFDQIVNHIGQFTWIFNQIEMPLIIRTPMGGGRGYGPTHSQSLEKHFCGVPGLKVFAIDQYTDIFNLYKNSIESKKPTLVIENKIIYGKKLIKDFNLKTYENPDVICLTYGGSLDLCLDAAKKVFEDEEIEVEVIPIRELNPLNKENIKKLTLKCKKFIIVEESCGDWGFSEACSSNLIGTSGLQVDFVKGPNHPIPSSKKWEQRVLPNQKRIYETIINLFKK